MTARPVHRLCHWMIPFALSAVGPRFARQHLLAHAPGSCGISHRSIRKRPPSAATIHRYFLRDRPASFDVVSIHPNNSDHSARTHIYSYANVVHFIAINATSMQLLEYAYAFPDSRILGVSAWKKSAKYDIEGKSDPAFAEKQALLVPYREAKDQFLKMVQSLLVDRFHLAAHRDSRVRLRPCRGPRRRPHGSSHGKRTGLRFSGLPLQVR